MKFEKIIRKHLEKNPPATVKEAGAKIEKLTGIKRCETQIREFLKKMGMRLLKVGQIPAKADPKQQKEYKKTQLEPRLKEARKGTRLVFFVDAAHFVMGGFLGYLWCTSRKFIQTPSGRKRFNVLGALNAITKEIITVTNDNYINSPCVCELLENLRKRHPEQPITLFLDNAKYQRCQLVYDKAKELGIELLHLPPYSPNLNLIERLWKWLKRKCLYSKYYEKFADFKRAISTTLELTHTDYKKELSSILTCKFQTIKKTQILKL
jgi:transposase